jgi:hypothetical protein
MRTAAAARPDQRAFSSASITIALVDVAGRQLKLTGFDEHTGSNREMVGLMVI